MSVTSATPGVRPVLAAVEGMATSDGAGVSMTRMLGSPRLRTLDPFLIRPAIKRMFAHRHQVLQRIFAPPTPTGLPSAAPRSTPAHPPA